MRATRTLSVAVLVGIVAGLASDAVTGSARDACERHRSCGGLQLPAPITIAPGEGLGSVTFRLGRDGRIRRIPGAQRPFPRDASWFPGTGTWYAIRHRHLVVGQWGRRLWRSHREIASARQIGVVVASRHAVAFQHGHRLYVATLRDAERPVAHREQPLGWTTGGLYTYGYQGRRLLLRSDTGALVKVIARRPLESDYPVVNGTLCFISHGVLMSAHGASVSRLGSLHRLGISTGLWLQPLGRLIELEDNHRLLVVRPDGSVFARAPLPLGRGRSQSISSSLVIAPRASAVAFTAASDGTGDPHPTRRASDAETVYLLRSGSHTAIPLHSAPATSGCVRWAALAWHGRWLLYSSRAGNLAVIDTMRAHHAIDLGRVARSLPGTRNGFTASWSGQPTGWR